jgi:hypothetical protein
VNDDLKSVQEKRPIVTEVIPENIGIRTHSDGMVVFEYYILNVFYRTCYQHTSWDAQ